MRKNKIFKRVLAFASTFIVLCSILILPCFAQSNDYNYIDYGDYYVTSTFYTPDSSTQSFKALCYMIVEYDLSVVWNVPIENITVYYTEYFYSNYYSGDFESDIEIVLDNSYLQGVISFVRNGYPNSSPQGYSPSLSYDGDFMTAYNEFSTTNGFLNVSYDFLYNYFETNYNNQFAYWETEMENAFNDGFDTGYYDGYYEGENDGYSIGYVDGTTVGYTNALNDFDMFERGLFDIFNAPFIFVRNIVGFEIFGITISDVIIGVLLLCLGFVLIKFIGGAIPL